MLFDVYKTLCTVGTLVLKFNIYKWNMVYGAVPVHRQMECIEHLGTSETHFDFMQHLVNFMCFQSAFPLEGEKAKLDQGLVW